MSAPELSAEERAIVERFEAAPEPSEILRERVARAIFDAADHDPERWGAVDPGLREFHRQQADAAIAVLDPSSHAGQALERVLAMVERVTAAPTSATDELWAYAIRAAVEGPSC